MASSVTAIGVPTSFEISPSSPASNSPRSQTPHPKKLALVQRRFPAVTTTADFQDLLRDPSIDAIAIATPVSTHFELGMAALKAGKHLWLEKPMTETSLQARSWSTRRRSASSCCSSTTPSSTPARCARCGEIVASGELGKICYYDSSA